MTFAMSTILQMSSTWAEQLRQDKCEYVRAAAEYQCQSILKSIHTSSLSEIDERQLQDLEPKIYFEMASILFSGRVFKNGFSEYTVSEFEAYIDSLSKGLYNKALGSE
jgi:hypothetical protein